MWELYGESTTTVWHLPANHFFAMAREIDKVRKLRSDRE